MKHLSLVLLIVVPYFSFSQNLRADVFAGLATYQGDLQGKRLTFDQSRLAVGLGASYSISEKFATRIGFTYGVLEGDDKKNTVAKGIEFRNLRFATKITELHIGLEYNFFKLEGKSLTPYVFAGVAIFHFNPYTKDTSGNKFFLKPLSTEGQGLAAYPSKKPYNLTQLSLPFGGGIKFRLSDDIQIALEVGLRKTFTDYLDDVSDNYVDAATLLAAKGPKAVELAYRGNEFAGAPAYPTDGTQRGSVKTKDWYYFSLAKVSKTLYGKNGRAANGSKKMGCPKNVY
jgi:Domain of unknown function (DUF6089)